jgi:hypothetical protein
LDEPVVVWTTPSGAPQRLEWRGRRFVVCAKPTPWVDRVPWWRLTTRAPAGAGGQLLEQPMWRVQAMALDDKEVVVLDLAVGTQGDWWRAMRAHE